MKFIYFLALAVAVAIVFGSCTNEKNQLKEKSIEEIRTTEFDNASIIRNPVSANEPLDTVNVAKFKFEEPVFNFGTVNEGDIVRHTYQFENTGKVPLVISDARSTCGCTIPKFPKDPIGPGGAGQIKVEFRTKGRINNQSKKITIIANTYPKDTKLILKGKVTPQ